MNVKSLNYHGSIFHFAGWRFVYKGGTNPVLVTDLPAESTILYDVFFEFPIGKDVVTELNDINSILYLEFVCCYSFLYNAKIINLEFTLVSGKQAELKLVIIEADVENEYLHHKYPKRLKTIDRYVECICRDKTMGDITDGYPDIAAESIAVYSPTNGICKSFCEVVYCINTSIENSECNAAVMIIPDKIFDCIKTQVENLSDYSTSNFGRIMYSLKLIHTFGLMYYDTSIPERQMLGVAYFAMAQCIISFDNWLRIIFNAGITRTDFVWSRSVFLTNTDDEYRVVMTAVPIGLVTSGNRATYITVDDYSHTKCDCNGCCIRDYSINFVNGYENVTEHQKDIIAPTLITDWATLYSDGANPFWIQTDMDDNLILVKPVGCIRINTHKQLVHIPYIPSNDSLVKGKVAYVNIYVADTYKGARRVLKMRCGIEKYHIFYPKKESKTAIFYKSVAKNPNGNFNYILIINNTIKIGELNNIPDTVQYTPMEVQLMTDLVAPDMDLSSSDFYQVTPALTIASSPETMM